MTAIQFQPNFPHGSSKTHSRDRSAYATPEPPYRHVCSHTQSCNVKQQPIAPPRLVCALPKQHVYRNSTIPLMSFAPIMHMSLHYTRPRALAISRLHRDAHLKSSAMCFGRVRAINSAMPTRQRTPLHSGQRRA